MLWHHWARAKADELDSWASLIYWLSWVVVFGCGLISILQLPNTTAALWWMVGGFVAFYCLMAWHNHLLSRATEISRELADRS